MGVPRGAFFIECEVWHSSWLDSSGKMIVAQGGTGSVRRIGRRHPGFRSFARGRDGSYLARRTDRTGLVGAISARNFFNSIILSDEVEH